MIYVRDPWFGDWREIDGVTVNHVIRVMKVNGRIKGRKNQTIYDLLMAGV